jgi:uncharacterized protein YkwD
MSRKLTVSVIAILLFSLFSPLYGENSSPDIPKIKKLVFHRVNQERSKRRLSALKYNQELEELATIHSRNMVKHGFISHIDHNQMDLDQRQIKYLPQLFLGPIGENIAYVFGTDGQQIAEKLMTRWMNSSGHRKNILHQDYTHMGVGIRQKGNYFYATQVFGVLVAKMVSELPQVVPYGSEMELKFEFFGSFPKEKITIFVHFPDTTAEFLIDDNSYYTGCGLYKPQWEGKYFTIKVKFDKGRGIYRLTLGSYGSYYSKDMEIRVQ